jgi:hypothetical protein
MCTRKNSDKGLPELADLQRHGIMKEPNTSLSYDVDNVLLVNITGSV